METHLSPEDVERLYWVEMRNQDWVTTAGKPDLQRQNHINVWTAVIAAIRKPYQLELERLREEVRSLRACDISEIMLAHISEDAKRMEVIR
jgi:hypothetical protein